MPIRILLVEDHFLPRFAVTRLIEETEGMSMVATAENGWPVVALYREHRPTLVLMDLRLPGMDGVDATAALLSEDPQARVLVLSQYESQEDVSRAVRAGARGYVKKDVGPETLLEAIRTVAAGNRYIPEELADRASAADPGLALSRRELQILRLVYQGRSNPEIGAALGIREGTVRVHMTHIMAKLEVKRRTEAVMVALQRGLLRDE